MTMIEITDEMVERFIKVWWVGPSNADTEAFLKPRKALDAALNSPPEHEAEVITPLMREFGGKELARLWRETDKSTDACAEGVYRTMRGMRPPRTEPDIHPRCKKHGCFCSTSIR